MKPTNEASQSGSPSPESQPETAKIIPAHFAAPRHKSGLRKHVTIHTAADLLGMHVMFIKRRIKDGSLEAYRLGGRLVVPVDALQSFLENRRVQPEGGQDA